MKKQQSKIPETEVPVIKLEIGDEILNADEASKLLKIKRNQIYQLTHAKKIRYFKPSHRVIRFLKSDLLAYIMRNPCLTQEQIDQKAQNIYENLTI